MEEQKNEKKKQNPSKILNENQLKELEKDVENIMNFKVVRNQKTSLLDPLDILTKEPTLIPIEKQIAKNKNKDYKNSSKTEIKIKQYNIGLEINYFIDKNGLMEICSINNDSMEDKILQNLESTYDSKLDLYIRKLFCKLNYSPIIKKIFEKP